MEESPRIGVSGYVVRALRQALFEGRLKPGQRLSPTKLADSLGVSHIPVREALSALEGMGHAIRIPYRGYFVADISLEELDDIYRWRTVLEEAAHGMAMPHITDDDVRRMKDLNGRLRITAERGDRRGFGELNRTFHFVLFEGARSPVVVRFLAHLWDHAARYQAVIMPDALLLPLLHEQHDALIQAAVARDAERANRIMATHRGAFSDLLRRLLGEARPAAKTRPSQRSGDASFV